MNYLNMIDHTLLKNNVTRTEIHHHCFEAVEMGAFSVCINPVWVNWTKEILKWTDVKVCTVIGFPLGAVPAEVKAFEAKNAVKNGVDEIDMVINIGAAKSGLFSVIEEEIKLVKEAVGDTLVKVIIETSEFNTTTIRKLCDIVAESGVEYIKTSTGTTNEGATVENVKLMVEVGDGRYKVKASGGVNNLEIMKEMIEAGADRIGTSGGLRILKEVEGQDVSNEKVSNY